MLQSILYSRSKAMNTLANCFHILFTLLWIHIKTLISGKTKLFLSFVSPISSLSHVSGMSWYGNVSRSTTDLDWNISQLSDGWTKKEQIFYYNDVNYDNNATKEIHHANNYGLKNEGLNKNLISLVSQMEHLLHSCWMRLHNIIMCCSIFSLSILCITEHALPIPPLAQLDFCDLF